VVLFFIAMRHATLALATLTHNMAPIFVSWIAPWWEKRPTNRSVWVGILLAIAGVGLVAYPANGWFIDFNYWGMAYGIASALMFAGHILFGKHLAKHLDSWVSLSWHRLIAALLLAPLAGYELFTLLPKQYMLLSAGGLVINGLAGWLFFTGIRYVSAEKVATLTLLEPVTAVVWGVLLWQESLSLLNFLGVVLVLTSVYVVIRANPSRQEGSLAENIFSPKDSAANCS
jgi:drug/metabolite transporter (DMT)-like permease